MTVRAHSLVMSATAVLATVSASAAGAMSAQAQVAQSLYGFDGDGMSAFVAVGILMTALSIFRFARGIQTTTRSLNKVRGMLTPGESFEDRMAAKMRELQGDGSAMPVEASAPAPFTAPPPIPDRTPLATTAIMAQRPAAPTARTFGRKVG